jgi:hypothetical protein
MEEVGEGAPGDFARVLHDVGLSAQPEQHNVLS